MISLKRLFGLTPEQKLARRTIKELSALSDFELNDLGISRSEIYWIANEPVRELIKKENYEAGNHYMKGRRVATWKGKAHA
jgi:uncharacterized protein YjiS (DUF1127 family)